MHFEPVINVVNKYMQDLKADLDSSDLIQSKSEIHDEPKITEGGVIGEFYKPSKFEDRKIKSSSEQSAPKHKTCFPDPECYNEKTSDSESVKSKNSDKKEESKSEKVQSKEEEKNKPVKEEKKEEIKSSKEDKPEKKTEKAKAESGSKLIEEKSSVPSEKTKKPSEATSAEKKPVVSAPKAEEKDAPVE